MWRLTYIVVTLVALTAALDENELLERDDIIEAVNNAQTTWKAGRNFDPYTKKSYVKLLLGLKKSTGSRLPPLLDDDDDNVQLPENFDARQKWDKCISLQQVRDQGPCGSCWAVGAASAFTDRLCIASKGAFNGHLSVENVLSCCRRCGRGCEGGYIDEAWLYFETTGITTGGDYNSNEGCQPYTMPECEHHMSGPRKNCSEYGKVPTPECKDYCYNKNYKEHSYKDDLHKVKKAFRIDGNIKAMQKEIYEHGPLETGFTVYEDFLSYKSGVYQHMKGSYLGGHAVKVIGWGIENDTPYWLVANSWNSDWGDQGLFKIKRGECDFGYAMTGGHL